MLFMGPDLIAVAWVSALVWAGVIYMDANPQLVYLLVPPAKRTAVIWLQVF